MGGCGLEAGSVSNWHYDSNWGPLHDAGELTPGETPPVVTPLSAVIVPPPVVTPVPNSQPALDLSNVAAQIAAIKDDVLPSIAGLIAGHQLAK